VVDFVNNPQIENERKFYNQVYVTKRLCHNKKSIDSLLKIWQDTWNPQNKFVLDIMRNISGKRVLLLGNGDSPKELYFLNFGPSVLIYSDLSLYAVSNVHDNFDLSGYRHIVKFAAIDAYNLPLFDNSIDVVYGYGMVHHLSNLSLFFSEIFRVLSPGGYCVFVDDAYSPIWHFVKQTLLRPLMIYSHRKSGISPEDYRFSMSGGFQESLLAEIIFKVGGKPWFQRIGFFQYLWYRGVDKLLSGYLRKAFTNTLISKVLFSIDDLFAKIPWARNNLIRLVWGLKK